MGKLNWNMYKKTIIIEDPKTTMALVLDKEDGVHFIFGDYDFEVNLDDVGFVLMEEPKLLKKGSICFFDDNRDVIKVQFGDINLGLVVGGIKKSNSDDFYAAFSILKDNGVEIEAL